MLIDNPRGGYRFLPGIAPYSCGVVADSEHEIVRVTLRSSVPYARGFDRILAHLEAAGRPRQALCGVELRSPKPFSRAGFLEFNRAYCALLEEWDLLVGDQNPVARTNVAPQWCPPDQPGLYGFSYTVSPSGPGHATFVVAGAGELRGGSLLEAPVVRPGETSPEAMSEKAQYVMTVMTRRLEGLGVSRADVTATQIYTVQPWEPFVRTVVLDRIGAAGSHGLRWYPARPPIDELEYEMDIRGVRQELFL